jgi:MATE family multidrug resistance protein
MGWIGTTALAAHQIALQVATILFMVPFGISLAATVRVGHAVGRRNPVATRRAGFGAIALGAALMAAMTVIVVAFRDAIPLLFLADDRAENAAAAQLAATLLLIGASFFVTDGVQGIAAGALRGLNDTRVPMLFAAVSFWLIGFTCAYGLAFPGGLGAVGIWIGFSTGVATFAALLVCRFHELTVSQDARRRTKDG